MILTLNTSVSLLCLSFVTHVPVRINPMSALEFLFFAVFGQTTPENLKTKDTSQPEWTLYLFKFVFGIYMLVSVVVLINLLIAMMSDTYQRIQVTKLRVKEIKQF